MADEIYIVVLRRNNGQAEYWSAEGSLMRYPPVGFLIDYRSFVTQITTPLVEAARQNKFSNVHSKRKPL